MEYFSYAQLLFAIIAILGMLYIEIVNDRNRRSDNNYHNFKYNLLNIAKDNKNNVLEGMILECATFEDLEKIYKIVPADNHNIACDNEIKTKINLSEDVKVQSRLLIFPLIIIGFLSVGILWMPIVKRMYTFSSLYWLTPAIISIVIIYAVICACCIARYPYVGKGRSALKKFVLIWK